MLLSIPLNVAVDWKGQICHPGFKLPGTPTIITLRILSQILRSYFSRVTNNLTLSQVLSDLI